MGAALERPQIHKARLACATNLTPHAKRVVNPLGAFFVVTTNGLLLDVDTKSNTVIPYYQCTAQMAK